MGRGIVNLDQLNAKLVEQDDDFRALLQNLLALEGPDVVPQILAEGLAVIHERLGNLIITNMSSGGS